MGGMGCMGLDEWTTGPVFALLNRHPLENPEELKKHQRRDFLALSEQEEHETRLLEKRPAWPQQGSSHRLEAEPNVKKDWSVYFDYVVEEPVLSETEPEPEQPPR